MTEREKRIPDRYKKGNRDLIQDWQERGTLEQNRAILLFNIEKYTTRYGKKDAPVIEAEKIMNYAIRLYEYEMAHAKPSEEEIEEAVQKYCGEV